MRKLLCIAVLTMGFFLITNQNALAQADFGIRGGVNFAKEVADDDQTDVRTGLLIGIYASVPINNSSVVFQPELLYSQKGGTFDVEGSEVTDKIDYIEVPLLFRFNFETSGSIMPHIYAGPYLAYNVNTEVEAEGASIDADEFVKDFDLGGTVGIGIDFDQLSIGARYSRGFTSFVDSDNSDFEAYNNVISIVAGFNF